MSFHIFSSLKEDPHMTQMNLLKKMKIPAIKLSFIISLILVETAKIFSASFLLLKNKAISYFTSWDYFQQFNEPWWSLCGNKMNKHTNKKICLNG